MKKRYIVLLAVLVALLLLVGVPVVVSAASGGDALAGLKEFYSLLIALADKALAGYAQFLAALT